MTAFDVGGEALGNVHRKANREKFFCHFTGFLEGVAASGDLEDGEFAPLVIECQEFVSRIQDEDAQEILEDFKLELLEHETVEVMVDIRSKAMDASCEKSRVNHFLGFCRGVVCDGIITLEEAKGLVFILDEEPEMLNTVGVRQIYVCCMDAIADEYISPEESLEICEAIGHIVGDSYGDTGMSQVFGVTNFSEFKFSDFELEIEGANVCFTGSFQTRPRRILEEKVAALGAHVSASVSQKTDFIFIGGEASRDWIEMNRGTKIRKAQALSASGHATKFVSEVQVLRHL